MSLVRTLIMLSFTSVGFTGDVVGIELYLARFCLKWFTFLNLLIKTGKGLIIKFITINKFSLCKLVPKWNIDALIIVVVNDALIAFPLIPFPVFIPILIGSIVLEILHGVYSEFLS